jgi:putative endonuclease
MTGSIAGKAAGKGGRSRRKALGMAGEDLAAAWYEARGYEVLARNWSCRDGELDIVLRRGRLNVFCEVKARSSGAFGLPAEAVGPLKQARVRRLAALWFAELSRGDRGAPSGRGARSGGPVRFDVASVQGGEVTVIEGAF